MSPSAFHALLALVEKEMTSFNEAFNQSITAAMRLRDEETKCFLEKFNQSISAAGERIKEYGALGKKAELGFNVFTFIKKEFEKENYHNRLLVEFLKLKEEGELVYLKSFIRFLNGFDGKPLEKLKEADFGADTRIETERHRIDLLLRNEASKKAIIIESKINNAGDQERQLPRYKEAVENEGYTVVAIVYLPLDPNKKEPIKCGWKPGDEEAINPLLKTVPAYQDGKRDLHAWLSECVKIAALQSDNVDVISAFRQYKKLIQFLGKEHRRNHMEKQIMQKFLESVKKQDYEELRRFKEMLDKVPRARAEAVKAHYEADPEKIKPFKKVWIWKETCVVIEEFHYKVDGESFPVVIDTLVPHWGEDCGFICSVFIRDKEKEITKEKLAFLECLTNWDEDSGRYVLKTKPIKNLQQANEELFAAVDKILERCRAEAKASEGNASIKT